MQKTGRLDDVTRRASVHPLILRGQMASSAGDAMAMHPPPPRAPGLGRPERDILAACRLQRAEPRLGHARKRGNAVRPSRRCCCRGRPVPADRLTVGPRLVVTARIERQGAGVDTGYLAEWIGAFCPSLFFSIPATTQRERTAARRASSACLSVCPCRRRRVTDHVPSDVREWWRSTQPPSSAHPHRLSPPATASELPIEGSQSECVCAATHLVFLLIPACTHTHTHAHTPRPNDHPPQDKHMSAATASPPMRIPFCSCQINVRSARARPAPLART